MHSPVLILVVVEYGLGLLKTHYLSQFAVLILVVVEYGLGQALATGTAKLDDVLILVVVEYGLGLFSFGSFCS